VVIHPDPPRKLPAGLKALRKHPILSGVNGSGLAIGVISTVVDPTSVLGAGTQWPYPLHARQGGNPAAATRGRQAASGSELIG
jgi:hypothetical protein